MPRRKRFNIGDYRKTVAACVGAVLVTIPLVWDMKVTQEEAMALVVAWATAFGVYQIPNDDAA